LWSNSLCYCTGFRRKQISSKSIICSIGDVEMTNKEKLIEELQTQFLDHQVIFVEILDDGNELHREMAATREHIIDLIEKYFDDNLHGHFKDEVYTTIQNATYKVIE
jgi:RNA-binding protein YhbY